MGGYRSTVNTGVRFLSWVWQGPSRRPRLGLKAKPELGWRSEAASGRRWARQAPPPVTPSVRAAPLSVTAPRPRGGRCPVTACDGRGPGSWFINWQLKLPTRLWSWWRRRQLWQRLTHLPRCRRRLEPEGPLPAETSIGCAPSWPEVGVRRQDPVALGVAEAQPGAGRLRAAAMIFLDNGCFNAQPDDYPDLLSPLF